MYTTAQHAGNPLYCGNVYAAETGPWVALPYREYGDSWQCGDLVYLSFGNGDALMARALDTGPFGRNCVIRGNRCIPILVDVPELWWPDALAGDISAPVRMVNITRLAKELGLHD